MENIDLQGKIRQFFTYPKIVFIILGIIVLVELGYAVKSLTSQKMTASPANGGASMSLNAAKTEIKVGETVSIPVVLDAAGYEIAGVDLIVSFDPRVIEVVSLTKGTIFAEYPVLSKDVGKGIISISGVSPGKNGFAGAGQFAMINIKAKIKGKTALVIDFKKGSTTTSNMVEVNSSRNILEEVNNLELEIR